MVLKTNRNAKSVMRKGKVTRTQQKGTLRGGRKSRGH